MNLVRIVAPAEPLVSLTDLKQHLRVDHDDDDGLISSLFASAMAHIDGPRGVLGRCIQPQTWEGRPDPFSGFLRLPLPGIDDVSAYREADDGQEDLALNVRRRWPWTEVALAEPEAGDGVVISMVASTPEDIWPVIGEVVKLLVGHWYANREAVVAGTIATTIPLAVTRLLHPLKITWV